MIRLNEKLIKPLALLLLFLSISVHAVASEAEKEDRQALNITLHPLDNNSRAENSYRKALQLVQRGQNNDAEALLQYSLSLQADHLPAIELMTSLLAERNAIQDAVALLNKGVIMKPGHARFPLWLAQLHIKLDEQERALSALEQSATRFQQHPVYLGALASLYQQFNRHADARQNFLQATRLSPQDGRWWLGLGISEEALENWAEAEDAYRRAKDYSFINGTLLQFAQQRLTVVNAKIQQQKS